MSDGDFQITDRITEVSSNIGGIVDELTWNVQSRPGADIIEQMEQRSEFLSEFLSTPLQTRIEEIRQIETQPNPPSNSRIQWVGMSGAVGWGGLVSYNHLANVLSTPMTTDGVNSVGEQIENHDTLTSDRLLRFMQDSGSTTQSGDLWNPVHGHVPTSRWVNSEVTLNDVAITSTPETISPSAFHFIERYLDKKDNGYTDILDKNLKEHWKIRGEH